MSTQVLEKDINIKFPHFIILKASAGSGKTYTLTQRYVQFILSEKIPHNRLKNLLAITFSNNSANEMRNRILNWLKSIYFENTKEIKDIFSIISLDKEKLKQRAYELIEEILNNYSDFQVKTIDSFMTSIFKASAIDFGYNPDFDILLDKNALLRYAFDTFLKNIKQNSMEAKIFEKIISTIQEQKGKDTSYLWDPSEAIFNEIDKLYTKLSSYGKDVIYNDTSDKTNSPQTKIKKPESLEELIDEKVESIDKIIKNFNLEKNRNSSFDNISKLVKNRMFPDLLGKKLNILPIKKPKNPDQKIQRACKEIESLCEKLNALIDEYALNYSVNFYVPYIEAFNTIKQSIENIKKLQDKIFIEDINKYLSEYINNSIVPDVYFRLGETVYHFLIDEFQDTSPIQWRNLFPLIENSLSQNGSLMVVGDTKQAIYGFRNADYRIMKGLEEKKDKTFPSASYELKTLDINFRSCSEILKFNEKIFKENIKKDSKYKIAAEESGLIDYEQRTAETEEKNKGYVEVTLFEKNDNNLLEKEKIYELIGELCKRGYCYSDITILTHRNEHVVNISSWLNEKNIPFLSYSSLDIRKRKITGEIVSLLSFLDSPSDNLSFATFILSDLFCNVLKNKPDNIDKQNLIEFLFNNKDKDFLYKSFQEIYKSIWDEYFSKLFKSVGYLPLYDLVTEIYNTFEVFNHLRDEEATLIKILEVIKEMEGNGYNNIKDFIESATQTNDNESEWEISIPKQDAVSVMTIHKAKGLGFPVVIVLLYEETIRGFDYFIEEKERGISLLKINKNIALHNDELNKLYEREHLKELVNKLNTLYVGFTRAKNELYVIGVVKNKDKVKYPLNFLPEKGSEHLTKSFYKKSTTPQTEPLEIRHIHKNLDFKDTHEASLNINERKRGEFIHKVLANIEYIGDNLDEMIDEIINKVEYLTGLKYSDTKKIIYNTVTNNSISEYFKIKPDRKVLLEQEFSDSNGKLFRMDRVILDKDSVTLIDYKTGDKDKDKYVSQMKIYSKILTDVFPDKKINSFIVFVDSGEVKGLN